MDLPVQIVDAVASALQYRDSDSLPRDVRILDLVVDESFGSDGLGGSDIRRLYVTALNNGVEAALCVVTKGWSPTPWLVELTGLTVWFEILFYEDGLLDDINSIPGIHVPIIGSFRSENRQWIIMDDASAALAKWKDSTAGPSGDFWQASPGCFGIYANLSDRIAHLHARLESPECQRELGAMRQHLAWQDRKLRSFESLFREWFGSGDSGHRRATANPPGHRVAGGGQWASRKSFAFARKQNYESFLARQTSCWS